MREIEIKATVKDVAELEATLVRTGIELGQPVTQHDEVFGKRDESGAFAHGKSWLRVRTEESIGGKKAVFTLKRRANSGPLDSLELETEVQDGETVKQMMPELGYVAYSEITKTRRKARMGNIEVCVDSVERLGDFIEAEIMAEDTADHDAVVAELWELFTKLGIDKNHEVHEGYDVLLRERDGMSI